MTQYCLGFMFSENMNRVLLIRKLKPDFQKGKMNGIGGKVELGEVPDEAMVRETREETGLETDVNQWSYFAKMECSDYNVHCFWTKGDIDSFKQLEAEKLEIVKVKNLVHREDLCHNIMWLVHLILDSETKNPIVVKYD